MCTRMTIYFWWLFSLLSSFFPFQHWKEEISCVNRPFNLEFNVKIRFSFFKSNFSLAWQRWIIPSCLQLCSAFKKGKSADWRGMKALGSDWMYLPEHTDEFDPHTARLPAFLHLSSPRSFCRDVTFASPPSAGLFPAAVTAQRAWAWIIIFETAL